jgi:hypothetical protein
MPCVSTNQTNILDVLMGCDLLSAVFLQALKVSHSSESTGAQLLKALGGKVCLRCRWQRIDAEVQQVSVCYYKNQSNIDQLKQCGLCSAQYAAHYMKHVVYRWPGSGSRRRTS